VKIWFLAILVFGGCSSLKKKDFEKELNKPIDEAKVSANPEDEKLLDKFEVHTVEENTKPVITPEVKVEKPIGKTSGKKMPKKESSVVKAQSGQESMTVVVSAPKEMKKSLPVDYPPEMLKLNEKGAKVWAKYKANHPVDEKMYLDIHYLGMTVGKILVVNKGKKTINGKEVWHMHARFKSAPFYSNIYELDDTVDTYVTTEDFLSIRYSLIQRESKVSVDDLQLNDRDQLKTFWFFKQKKVNGDLKNKKVESFIPHFSIDPFSVLFFYQGLPLHNKDVYEIPIVNKGKMLVLTSTVEGREVLETEIGEKKAIRVHATTQYTGETLKSGDIYFWFSDDDKRILLKAQAKIKIGSVTADIVKN
jgi:hypothetical protein